jgi:transcriptional regulator with XRE-family HTH domain
MDKAGTIELTLGEKIKILRERKELPQKALAKLVGKSRKTVSRVEANGQELKYSDIFIWAEALGVSAASLMSNTIPSRHQ